MSIYHKGDLIATTWNIIKDDVPQVNTSYSSERFNEVVKPTQDEINKKVALTKGVRDVVNTYQDLLAYDTTQLVEGDIINVLVDESKDNGSTYYRWDGQLPLTYIGEIPPFYTKTETDLKLDSRQDRLVDQVNIKTINNESLIGQGNIEIKLDLDKWFPIGTVYPCTDENVDPNQLFGGTWELISGRFLRSGTTANQTGGSNTVTLTTNQIPSHSHFTTSHTHSVGTTILSANIVPTPVMNYSRAVPLIRGLDSNNADGKYDRLVLYKFESSYSAWNSAGDTDWCVLYSNRSGDTTRASVTISSKAVTVNNNGGGQAHNNMHPYVSVNMWVRTA